ncbi:MAG: Lrp/AsnC family transcriptional regulator [Oscillospiraceae bacterium]|jgi:DNA-binding Lrp family transcriptional regulator|nr:Lrp/AsnC family transcriptional regulator [Oscillospiraceae bacterium]
MDEILKILERDGRLTAGQIAAMLGRAEADVERAIDDYETGGAILKYTAIIDWDKAADGRVTALIEVKISPQRGDGFDRIAERIYQYDEVDSLYLMSGSFDLTVIMSADSIREVAEFVYAKLATIDGVTGTATHFILKKYKEKGCVFKKPEQQEERMIFV